MMLITPQSTKAHSKLEDDVTAFLNECGFLVEQAPYHTTMSIEMVSVLQDLYTPTSLYLRSRADRIAVRAYPPLAFEWEAKTHTSSRLHDCTIEVYPVAAHLLKSSMDVRCLYIYRDVEKGYDVGFWIHQMPDIRVIMIPDRWNRAWTAWHKSYCNRFFPATSIRTGTRSNGTGDPFLIIDESIVRGLPHWKDLIRAAMTEDAPNTATYEVTSQMSMSGWLQEAPHV